MISAVLFALIITMLYMTSERIDNHREFALSQCEAFKTQVGTQFDVDAQRTRLETEGIDVVFDLSGEPGSETGKFSLSSNRLDSGQAYCQIELENGTLKEVL